ncbi:hypothetical protein BgiBS90_009736 [Biomphalaria glabrata]|nr:hypothetical protein BgiBS90_009736 [Biomphalaria glabrata]
MAIFINYIRSQEWDEDYFEVRDNLIQIKDNLNQALCPLTKIIEHATTSNIEAYVNRSNIKPFKDLENKSQIYKRAFVMFELIVLSQTLSTYVIHETEITLKEETLSTVQC